MDNNGNLHDTIQFHFIYKKISLILVLQTYLTQSVLRYLELWKGWGGRGGVSEPPLSKSPVFSYTVKFYIKIHLRTISNRLMQLVILSDDLKMEFFYFKEKGLEYQRFFRDLKDENEQFIQKKILRFKDLKFGRYF